MSGYDEHQRLRTKAVRLLSKKNYDAAATLLHDGSVKMLQADEQGSGCDLAIYMVDVFTQADKKPDEQTRRQILDVLKLAKADFWRKKLTDSISKWLSKSGGEAGDPLLRLEMARILAAEGSYFQSEPHFHAAIVPPSVSAEQPKEVADAAKELGSMMVRWLKEYSIKSAEEHKERAQARPNPALRPDAGLIQRVEAGRFALRGLLPLLTAGKVPAAHAFLKSFLDALLALPACKTLLLPSSKNPNTFAPPPGVTVPATRKVLPPGEAAGYKQTVWITANSDINFAQMCLGLVDCAWLAKGEAAGLSRSERGASAASDQLKNAWVNLMRQHMKEGLAGSVDQIVSESINALSGLFFDLQQQKAQGNMLADMMSSLFGGPAGGAAGAQQQQPKPQGAKWVAYRQPADVTSIEDVEEEEEVAEKQAKTIQGAKPRGAAPSAPAPPIEEDLD